MTWLLGKIDKDSEEVRKTSLPKRKLILETRRISPTVASRGDLKGRMHTAAAIGRDVADMKRRDEEEKKKEKGSK